MKNKIGVLIAICLIPLFTIPAFASSHFLPPPEPEPESEPELKREVTSEMRAKATIYCSDRQDSHRQAQQFGSAYSQYNFDYQKCVDEHIKYLQSLPEPEPEDLSYSDDIVTQVFKEGETRYKSCVGETQERLTIKEKSYAEHGMSIINLNADFTAEFKQKCLNQFSGLFLQRAVELHRSGDLENAKLLYQHILNSKDDHNQRVYYELGDIAYIQEDYIKAVDYWEKADEAWVGVDYLHSNYTLAVQKAKQQESKEKIEERDSFFDNLFESDKSEIPRDEIVCGKGTVENEFGQCVLDTKSSKGGGCLIATATFGSELAPQVQMLREIRDNSLLQTQSGQYFMQGFNQFYYSFSPAIADYERQNPVFKEAVKLVITPLLTSLSLLNYVDLDSEESVLGYGISLIMLNVGMYFVGPVMVIHRIKKILNS